MGSSDYFCFKKCKKKKSTIVY